MKSRLARVIVVAVVMIGICGVFAGPAAAISQIDNYMTRNDSTLNTGQKVTFTTKTVYDWQYVPNPYTSDYYTEINANGFNKPVTTKSVGINKSWGYKNPGWFLTAAWYIDSGIMTIVTTRTVSMNFYATAKSGWSSVRTRHGQSEHWDVSWGSAVWHTFTHN